MLMPAPAVRSASARSWTRTRQPRRARAAAAVNPAKPPPTTSALRAHVMRESYRQPQQLGEATPALPALREGHNGGGYGSGHRPGAGLLRPHDREHGGEPTPTG